MTSLLQFKNRKQNSKEFKNELESIPYKNFFSFLHNRAEISSFTHTVHKMWSTTTQHLDFFGLQIKMWKIVRTSKLTNHSFSSSPNFNPLTKVNTTPRFWIGMRGVAKTQIEDLIEYYLILKFGFKISINAEVTTT